jgi:hypothetical protein
MYIYTHEFQDKPFQKPKSWKNIIYFFDEFLEVKIIKVCFVDLKIAKQHTCTPWHWGLCDHTKSTTRDGPHGLGGLRCDHKTIQIPILICKCHCSPIIQIHYDFAKFEFLSKLNIKTKCWS